MKKYWVYVHTCNANGKRYVGITTAPKPEMRWKEGRGYWYNKHFYSAILKHGWNNFQHEVFEVDSEEEMYRKEVELISFYHTNDPNFGYNHSSGGEKGALGCKRSEELKKHLSEVNKKKCSDPEYRRKQSEASKKRWSDPEYRKRVSEALKNIEKKIHSDPEYRKKLSEVQKKVQSDPEVQRKRSESLKKSHLDPEYQRKQSEAMKEKWTDPEYRRKQSKASKKGKTLSEETKRKMSEAAKKRAKDPEFRRKMSEDHKGKPVPRGRIRLQDGTIVEVTKQNLSKNYINKGRKFEYVS